MKKQVVTVSRQGRITIPAEVRRHLGVAAHDKITFTIDDDGVVRVKRAAYPTIESLRGAAGSLERPIEWDEMKRIAYEDRATIARKVNP